jgi:hypothetical protein
MTFSGTTKFCGYFGATYFLMFFRVNLVRILNIYYFYEILLIFGIIYSSFDEQFDEKEKCL